MLGGSSAQSRRGERAASGSARIGRKGRKELRQISRQRSPRRWMNGAERVCVALVDFIQQLKTACGSPKPAREWCSNSSISSGCSSAAVKVRDVRVSAWNPRAWWLCGQVECILPSWSAAGRENWGKERGLDCLTGRYLVVEARLAGARMLLTEKRDYDGVLFRVGELLRYTLCTPPELKTVLFIIQHGLRLFSFFIFRSSLGGCCVVLVCGSN